MPWIKPTRDDLTATTSAAEVEAFSGSADFGDAVDAVLSQTSAAVRGFVRAGGCRVASGEGLIPPSLLPFAMDFAAYRLLKRFDVPVGEDRRKAYDAAMDMFRRVAEGKMAVEPDDDAEGTSMPAVTPAAAPATPARLLD